MSKGPIPVTLGLEEEVFVLERGKLLPTLQSLDYLRKLLWTSPTKYISHSASNFAKKADRKECFMGSIEFSTGVHATVEGLVDDVKALRTEFARATFGGLVVPVGALFTIASPSNTASSHIHVGVPKEHRDLAYANLAYFAPLLASVAANSPWANGKQFGSSYRMAQEGLLGELREDREYRFQDLIISKRLGTIEMRIFDPIPELSRLAAIADAVQKIAALQVDFGFHRDAYNEDRKIWTLDGRDKRIYRKLEELNAVVKFSSGLLEETMSDRLGRIASERSVLAAYEEADSVWRDPTGTSAHPLPTSALRIGAGIAGYYAIRLPFMAWKGYREWYGKA